MAEIAISAVICTRNRAGQLGHGLESLAHQSVAPDRYEIVVVDNGSTDATGQVVERFAAATNVRYLFEPKVGLSRARNRGWREARGKYVVYLDDDAVATNGWLDAVLGAFTPTRAQIGCVGGPVLPRWEAPPPRWLTAKLRNYLSLIDWADAPCVIGPGQWLLGGNTAYPRRLLISLGGFREDLGRVGNRLLSMEEFELQKHIEARGLDALYVPAMTIYHHVSAARLRRRWFLRRCFWQGVSRARMNPGPRTPRSSRRVSSPFRPAVFEKACMAVEKMGMAWGALAGPPTE